MVMMCKAWNFLYAKEMKTSTILSMTGKSFVAQQ
jgi:hypothetical protein